MSEAVPVLEPGCVADCPGCKFRALNAGESDARKQDWLLNRLAPWADRVGALRASPIRWGYRERATLRAEWAGDSWKLGLRVTSREDPKGTVIAIPECPVHSPRIRALMELLSRSLPGPERLPLVFVSVSGSLLTLVVKAREAELDLAALGFGEAGATGLAKLGVTGVFVNFSPAAGQRVFSSRGWRQLWGEPRGRLELGALGAFEYGPDSFQQLIPSLFLRAMEEARAFLAPAPTDAVIDLCSGLGVSLRLWKQSGARTLGVELGGEAAGLAERNAGAGSCLRGRCSERLPQLDQWLQEREGAGRVLLFANPPRLGLEPEVRRWIAERARPARLAYLSCSAGTLSRDLSDLEKAGYAVRRITPYDFFPQTHHVETLALLEH
ncbi:MAG: class I SAM-dependent RNA methyltransferase [Oligoflexia bacterium]|nr:class I SAM-dependent RNA methyltransferase [Oligoflexia bacterium]